MPKYQVAAGVVSAPEGSFYSGTEVTAERLGIPQDRFDHLVTQGAIGEIKEERAAIEPIAAGAPAAAGRGTQIAGGEAAPDAKPLPGAPAKPATIPNEPPANDTKIKH